MKTKRTTMETTTLRKDLASYTVEHLGPEADEQDLTAFRDALRAAWPAEIDEPVSVEVAKLISGQVFDSGVWAR